MKKWTKKAVRELKSQLETFVLYNEQYCSSEQVEAAIEKHRFDIVVAGLETWAALLKGRADNDRATAAHYKSFKDSDDAVDRFTKMAAENDRATEYAVSLMVKLRAEGFPPEVADYVPRRGPRGWL